MKYPVLLIILAGVIAVIGLPLVAAADSTGSDQGWYVIHSNVYGADVYFDNKFMGTIQAGTLSIPAYTTGTPYKTIMVKKYGYASYSDLLPAIPGAGMTADVYATLNQFPPDTPTAGSGEQGWYMVRSNVNGASVTFDGVNKGITAQGVLYVEAPTAGSTFKNFSVEKDGYTPYYSTITRIPLIGETVDLYATLNPLPTTSPVSVSATTPALIGGSIGWYKVHSNVDGASVSFDNDLKGQISQGNLSVQVYTTATPYRTFTVYKAGYIPYTGTISQYPAEGETVYLNATLNPQPPGAESPVPSPTKSPVPPEITVLAVMMGGICTIAARRFYR